MKIRKRLNRNEIPNTRAAFVEKWNSDNVFRSKAKDAGFNVVFENVIFPDGKIADTRIA